MHSLEMHFFNIGIDCVAFLHHLRVLKKCIVFGSLIPCRAKFEVNRQASNNNTNSYNDFHYMKMLTSH